MFFCTECGNESLKWKGQCDMCKAWGSYKEIDEKPKGKKWIQASASPLISLEKKDEEEIDRIITKSGELNTVLWGGIVPGSIILLSGEPGIGKSTLTLQLWNWTTEEILYVSGEETAGQLSGRAKRLQIQGNNIKILAESNIETIFASIEHSNAKIIVFDSISVMHSSEINGSAGSVSQVRYITEKIVEYGKKTGIACCIIGHVTKDGSLAGPKTLEHMVDTVLYFEGDRYDNLRLLRSLKNRFWSSHEVGLYKMGELWLSDILNPWLECIWEKEETIWSALWLTLEGSRPLVVETEALTSYTKFWYPKRSSRGIPNSKLDLIIAVLWKYTSVKLESYDVYSNISRGISIEEPALDLALAASIISSKLGKKISKKCIFIGEISLTWNIKSVIHLEKRIKEAIKLWFTTLYCPKYEGNLTDFLPKKEKIQVQTLSHISELTDYIQ